jgi:hypothetical protein
MRVFLAGLALAALLPCAARAQLDSKSGTVALTPGARVGIQLDDKGASSVDPGASAAAGETSDGKPAQGKISLRFSGGAQSMLAVENGYDRALVYRARIHVGNRAASTSVCAVPPHLSSFESWPYPIDKIELSDFRLVEWKNGMPLKCE